MALIDDDEWKPDPDYEESILKKIVVNFTDPQIRRNKMRDANQPYDPTDVIAYAKEVKAKLDIEDEQNDDDDDDDEFEDDDAKKREKKKKNELFQQQLLGEQIYYDPLQDDENERWVDSKMKKHQSTNGLVLSCPQCFIQLCYDSQKHELYSTQYRSMVAMNCQIDCNKVCQPMEEKKAGPTKQASNKPIEIYFAVNCAQCEANVAVFEVAKKIYHFFNVIPGLG